jgi:hypothetical protein
MLIELLRIEAIRERPASDRRRKPPVAPPAWVFRTAGRR